MPPIRHRPINGETPLRTCTAFCALQQCTLSHYILL